MPLKINPITGQLDLVNASGGGGGSPDASVVTYSPAVPGDWSPAPAYVDVALNQLAATLASFTSDSRRYALLVGGNE